MAKIIVSTDDGEVISTFLDERDDIGDLSKSIARQMFSADISTALRLARQRDNRKSNGERNV